ncbi:MAG: tRNA (guanosine(46)-N7)-methyltransferase TrmB [Planctomycetaceae bacterium]|jgi:tRNA (guanine-N7-)-methyltransferase|nr:tRNA (guanosine(46)-N7)-methyltransferase TrmB [Planctomycetaceae bacterium]
MSRRSIKSISSDVDLSGVFRLYSELPFPFNSEVLFGRSGAIEFEIGSGKGRFLRRVSDEFVDRDFIGVEMSLKFARIAASKLLNRSCNNALVICCDAAKLLSEWFPDNFLHAVHVYFPDPWWKHAHRKRRILREDVLRLIERRLMPGGFLYFRTDVEEYFRSTLALIDKCTTQLEQIDVEISDELSATDTDYNTHFERRTILQGQKVFRTKFKKIYRKPMNSL